MKRVNIGLNGFGRIGRAFARIALDRNTFDVAAINTRKTPTPLLAYLLQYDSIYRKYGKTVAEKENGIDVGGTFIATTLNDSPDTIPWEKYNVDIVIDATGAFTKKEDLQKHIKGSVKKVILTAPTKDEETPHVVLGVNDDAIDWKKETVVSNASCTTNCAAPLFKVLEDNFKVTSGFLTTAHAYTLTQSLLDDANKTPDRSRSAVLNIAPSTTGAAKAVAKTIPSLKGKIDGMALRVPVPTVSFTDVSAIVEKQTTAEEVNALFKKASETSMKNILGYESTMLVSSDYIGSPYSCVLDANYTKVINGNLVKVFGWYDNEWGYATRLADLVEKMAKFI